MLGNLAQARDVDLKNSLHKLHTVATLDSVLDQVKKLVDLTRVDAEVTRSLMPLLAIVNVEDVLKCCYIADKVLQPRNSVELAVVGLFLVRKLLKVLERLRHVLAAVSLDPAVALLLADIKTCEVFAKYIEELFVGQVCSYSDVSPHECISRFIPSEHAV